MRFLETPIFTKDVCALMDDDAYRAMQLSLVLRPEQGSLIPGSGGLRKLRWPLKGEGKRGGLRVIYYWERGPANFYMLFVYSKKDLEDLTAEQIRVLGRLVRREFK